MVQLPKEERRDQQQGEADGYGEPWGAQEATFGGQQEGTEKRGEKEKHGGLVEEADAGQNAHRHPGPGAQDLALHEDQEQNAAHPEGRLEAVHGEIAVCAEVDRRYQQTEHGQGLCRASAAECPGEQAAEADRQGSGNGREDADAEDGVAEQHLAHAGLQGHKRPMVDIAPGEVAAAGEIIELVAEVAVAEVKGPKREREL